jgi:hypothetical protein
LHPRGARLRLGIAPLALGLLLFELGPILRVG